jgi:hypothetical protein
MTVLCIENKVEAVLIYLLDSLNFANPRNQTSQTVQMDNVHLLQKPEVKYLAMHLDRRLDMGKAHQIQKETAQPKSETNELATQKKINTIHRKQIPPTQTMLKPIWIYGIQLWGTASNSNIKILQRFQSKAL